MVNNMINNIEMISDKQLLQMYANAYATMSCGGHYKGNRNEELMKEYATALEIRNIRVPKTFLEKIEGTCRVNVDIPQGVFNGIGAY